MKLQKIEDDDIDVDIDLSDDSDENVKSPTLPKNKQSSNETLCAQQTAHNVHSENTLVINAESKHTIDLSRLDENTFKQINSIELPDCEMVLEANHITELEKVINWDYFDGGSSKTPQRYLKVSHLHFGPTITFFM